MGLSERVAAVLRLLAVLVVYSTAWQYFQQTELGLFLSVVVTVIVLAVVDAVPALLRGERPTFGERSYLYAARGFLALTVFVIVTAGISIVLREQTALSESLSTGLAVVTGGILVFGALVFYYWRGARETHVAGQ